MSSKKHGWTKAGWVAYCEAWTRYYQWLHVTVPANVRRAIAEMQGRED